MTDTQGIAAVIAGLDGIEHVADPARLRRFSRDFFWFSPILKPELEGRLADLAVIPKSLEELRRVVALCACARVPVTVRGGGTGNYGQAVPLLGGVVIDMTALGATVWTKPGAGRFQAGANLLDIDRRLLPERQELRFHPSTRSIATIGGFVAGGAGGVGSCTWGQLADRGAVLAVQVMTLEEEPRLVELRGAAAGQVLHTYGVNGIITEVEMPLAPLHPWCERIFALPTFEAAARFGHALCAADGIARKLVSIHDPKIPPRIRRLKPLIPEGQAMALVMVTEPQAEAVEALATEFGGTVAFARSNGETEAATFGEHAGGLPPIYEYSWNHTTLWAMRDRPETTYLQVRFPAGREVELAAEFAGRYGEELVFHLEFQRRFGRVFVSSLPLLAFTTPERLRAIVAEVEAAGASVSDAHSYRLNDAGWKRVDAPQAAFKREADPHGLMNPGKLVEAAQPESVA